MGSPPAPGPEDYWKPGDWNIICSICGTKLKFGDAVRNWQGMWRHVRCNEPRPAQDFVHAINSQEMAIPYPQTMGEVDIQICTLETSGSLPGVAVGGCMLPGVSTGFPCTTLSMDGLPGDSVGGCFLPGGPPP